MRGTAMKQSTDNRNASAHEAAATDRTAKALTGEQDMTYEACAALAASVGLSLSELVSLAEQGLGY